MSKISCRDCQKWMYDMKKGTRLMRKGGEEPQARRPGQATPCETCPREGPENERYSILSDRNSKTFMLFLSVRGGATLSRHEASDPIIRQNFAILQIIYDNWIQRSTANEMTQVMAISGMFGKQK